jgi:hypothetical protein
MDIEDDFANCDLTTAQKQTIQDCVNAILDRPCITQSELDAYITAIENGDEEATLGDPAPASCVQTQAIFEACEPQ